MILVMRHHLRYKHESHPFSKREVAGEDVAEDIIEKGRNAASFDAFEVETIEAVADRGYRKGEDIQTCEEGGIVAYVAPAQRSATVRGGFWPLARHWDR
jgi:hypothetical protein